MRVDHFCASPFQRPPTSWPSSASRHSSDDPSSSSSAWPQPPAEILSSNSSSAAARSPVSRVELAAGLARLAGEVADQVFVGVAEQVVGDVRAVEGLAAEVVDQVDELVARQFVLLVEVDLAGEDAVEVVLTVGVRPLDGQHGLVQRLAELALCGARHVGPGRMRGHREVVQLRVMRHQNGLFQWHAGLH